MLNVGLIIRRSIAIVFTGVYLTVGLLTAQYNEYLEVFRAMSIPEAIILGFYFGGNLMAKHKNNDKNED